MRILSYIILVISIVFSFLFSKNLYILFFASFVVFFFIYSFLIFILLKIRLRSISIDFLATIENCVVGEDVVINMKMEKLNSFIYPGFFAFLKFNIYEKESIVNKKIIRLEINDNFYRVIFKSFRHGKFLISDINIIFRDIFQFFSIEKRITGNIQLNVFPIEKDFDKFNVLLKSGGNKPIKSKIKLKSTDFFDTRKYNIGDDIRRINWKVFAHTGELHIRDCEKIPPNNGRINVLFLPYSKSNVEYECTTSVFIKFVNQLINQNYLVRIYSPGNLKNPSEIQIENQNKLYEIINSAYEEIKEIDYKIINEINHGKILSFFSYHQFALIEKMFKPQYFDNIYIIKEKTSKIDFNKLFYISNYDSLLLEIIFYLKKIKNNYKIENDKLIKILEVEYEL